MQYLKDPNADLAPYTTTIEKVAVPYEMLNDLAQQKVYEKWAETVEFFWNDEWRASIEAFCRVMGITLRNWRVDGVGADFDFYCDRPGTWEQDPTELRLWKYTQDLRDALLTDSEMTGYCGDYAASKSFLEWRPSRDHVETEEDWRERMRVCLQDAFDDWSRDIEYSYSKEAFAEWLEQDGPKFDRTNLGISWD